jgi:hypothetical protein
MKITRWGTAAAMALLVAAPTLAATPAQRCQSEKNKEAGKYAECRQKAEATFVITPDAARLADSLQRCLSRYQARWARVEAQAGGACPSTGDQGPMQTLIDVFTDDVAAALGGAPLPDCPGDLATCAADLGVCSADLGTCTSDLGTCTTDLGVAQADIVTCNDDVAACSTELGTCEGELAVCDAALDLCEAIPQGQRLKTGQVQCWDVAGTLIPCAGTGQDGDVQAGIDRAYVDNGDGTITDQRTGLMWEKFSNDGSIHDRDNNYTWTNAFTVKVGGLNSDAFAGHTDWRVPNVNELNSLVDFGQSEPAINAIFDGACPTGCTVLTCSCTDPFDGCWTSTSALWDFDTTIAWQVDFSFGSNDVNGKTAGACVRAVRDAS